MKTKAALASRYLLGLIYFVFGLNGFLNFIPVPPDIPQAAMDFSMAMQNTGYFLPFVKGTEVICGLLLLIGFYAPVALVILAPITLNIFMFHLVLTPGASNSIMPVVMIALHVTAACGYWYLYRPLFSNAKVSAN